MNNKNGAKTKIQDLEQGIELALPLDQASDADERRQRLEEDLLIGVVPQCKYWDKEAQDWSTDGCKAMKLTDDGEILLCSCIHLTDFNSVSEAADGALGGSNADVMTKFSLDGLRADNPVLWFVLGVFCINMMWIFVA